jgi:phage tail-like protein
MADGRPFTSFNFKVSITLEDSAKPLCDAAFAECSGLEATAQIKTVRSGGDNTRAIHLVGPVAYSQLSLKRGMTDSFDLWGWFERVLRPGGHHHRASCVVQILSSDRARADATFTLTGCLPVKLRAPVLNAKEGAVAIEEMQIAYETLALESRVAGGGGGA